MVEVVYSRNQINHWQSALKDFAKTPRTQFTKKQAVEAMMNEIEEALKNHSYVEVSETLKDSGLDISKGLLKQYVNGYRREHTSAKRKQSARKKAVPLSTENSQETKNQTVSKAADKKTVTNRRSQATKKATSKAK
ncbi:MAG: hypothetical protein DCF25_10150 [Leptolyngbya foveolarum]|uniref:Uncharacterized protein n=1 Tax=Leptolyngbya foveolarum TaxID=47253 RepID=A0A2W4UC30_9CYAN|nr:MAG: hypothetical protein DCF25_10150 [Leptolyngbya foveolarum]